MRPSKPSSPRLVLLWNNLRFTQRALMILAAALLGLVLWGRPGSCPTRVQESTSTRPFPTVSSGQSNLMIGSDATSCQSDLVANYFDPNKGKVHVGQTTTKPKVWVSVHNEDYDKVRYSLYSSGRYYEEELRSWFEQVLAGSGGGSTSKPGGWVMDVGANIGYFSLVAAGFGQNVLSFEPNPANVFRFCQSLQLNGGWDAAGRVSIFRNGVTDKSNGEMVLEWPEGKPGEAKLRQMKQGETFQASDNKAKTPLVALDSFAETRGWFDGASSNTIFISIMKIDVESHEIEVLEGAKRLLTSGIVKNVFVEFWKSTGPKIVDRMVDYGFVPNHSNMPKGKMDKNAISEALLKEMEANKQPPFNVWWKRAS